MTTETIFQKLKIIETDIDKLKSLEINDIKQLEDFKNFHLAERLIEKIIDNAISINQHIFREYFRKPVSSGKESFLELSKEKIFDSEFALALSNSVGLRNTIIHNYQKLNIEILFKSINLTIKSYSDYCKKLVNWLK